MVLKKIKARTSDGALFLSNDLDLNNLRMRMETEWQVDSDISLPRNGESLNEFHL